MRDPKTGRFMPKVTTQPSRLLSDLYIGILVIGGITTGAVALITQARL